MKDCDAKALITLPELWPNVQTALQIMKSNIPVICIKTKVFDFFIVIHIIKCKYCIHMFATLNKFVSFFYLKVFLKKFISHGALLSLDIWGASRERKWSILFLKYYVKCTPFLNRFIEVGHFYL